MKKYKISFFCSDLFPLDIPFNNNELSKMHKISTNLILKYEERCHFFNCFEWQMDKDISTS